MTVGVLKQYELAYIGSPYSLYPYGLDAAFEDVADICFRLKREGVNAFSPILYSHPLAKLWRIDPKDHDFWLEFDEAMMRKADALVIAKMESWEMSYGVSVEIDFFRQCDKPIHWLDIDTLAVR